MDKVEVPLYTLIFGEGRSTQTTDNTLLVECGCILGLYAILLFLWLH
jgi:hypothetical protein